MSNAACNTVRNGVSNPFATVLVTQPQRNGNPDPTRPDPRSFLAFVLQIDHLSLRSSARPNPGSEPKGQGC